MYSSSGTVGIRRYFRYGHHEVIAVTIDSYGRPDPAPMGIEALSNDTLVLSPYKTSRTFRNLLSNPEVTINVTQDSLLYFKALYLKDEIKFKPSRIVKPPIIDGDVDLYIECVVTGIRDVGDRAEFTLKVITSYGGRGSGIAYSRANSFLIEALVYVSKIEVLKGLIDCNALRSLRERVINSLLIVERLGSSDLIQASKFINSRVTSILNEYCSME